MRFLPETVWKIISERIKILFERRRLMKKTFLILCAAMVSCLLQAQDNSLTELKAEVRIDYQREWLDGSINKPGTGFKGKYVNIILNGNITPKFSYAYRQRLNKAHSDQTFFDATDWAYISYMPNARWKFSAGKQVVSIGGFEYDKAPINLFICSEFWNNIPCYEIGVSATYNIGGGNDRIVAQFCQSPFHISSEDMYGYNLMWIGNHGVFNTIYSANYMEFLPGKYIFYLALGNEFRFGGETYLKLDLMSRSVSRHSMLEDCSVMTELSHRYKKLNMFCKFTYDVNKSGREGDYCVLNGTELTSLGAGLEFFPVKGKDDIRLHANAVYVWGNNSNPHGTLLPKQTRIDIGITWRMNILSYIHKIVGKHE